MAAVLLTSSVIGSQRILQYDVAGVSATGQFTTGLKYITGATAVNTSAQRAVTVLIDATNTKVTCASATGGDNARLTVTGYGGG